MLVLIRGISGSGKTTLAKAMDGFSHFEADQFFMVGDQYVYNAEKIKDAHKHCQEQTLAALNRGENVVVCNTFCRLWEMEAYLKMGFPTQIIEAAGRYQNVHGVPDDKVAQMIERWEPVTDAFLKQWKIVI